MGINWSDPIASQKAANIATQHGELWLNLLKDHGVVPKLVTTGQLLGASFSFAQACYGIAALHNVLVGSPAQRALDAFYTKLGKDVSNISKDLDILVAHKNQHKFGRHVFRFWKYRTQQLEVEELVTGRKQYTVIYHHGTDWHSQFIESTNQETSSSSPALAWLMTILWCITALLAVLWTTMTNPSGSKQPSKVKPAAPVGTRDPRLLGIYHNINAMVEALKIIRKIIGPDAEIHILMPATQLTVIDEPLACPPELHPLSLEGEIHSNTGEPYYHLNMPGAPTEMFLNVHNMAELQLQEPDPSFGRKAAEVGAEVGAGVGGGIAGVAAGFLTVGMGAALLFPATAPLALGCVALAGMTGGGVAAGTASALSAGKAVKESFAKQDRDAKTEAARKLNAAAGKP